MIFKMNVVIYLKIFTRNNKFSYKFCLQNCIFVNFYSHFYLNIKIVL